MANTIDNDGRRFFFNGFVAVSIAWLILGFDLVTRFHGYFLTDISVTGWVLGLASPVVLIILFLKFFYNWGHWKLGVNSVILDALFIMFGLFHFSNPIIWLRILLLYFSFNILVLSTIDDEAQKLQQMQTFAIFLVLDYIVLGSLDTIGGFFGASALTITRFHIPIYIWYFSTFFIKKTRHWIFVLSVTIAISFFVFSMAGGQNLLYPDIQQASRGDITRFTQDVRNFLAEIRGFPGSIRTGIDNFINDTLFINQYSGEEEQIQDPQGVFLSSLDRGQIQFREGNPVYLLSRIEAKTLEQSIDIKVSCSAKVFTEEGEEEIFGSVTDGGALTQTVTVLSSVERSIPCIFNDLPAGFHEVTYKANFDFGTDAREKVYLMDRNRYNNDLGGLLDKGLEPTKANLLTELYDITEIEPVTIFTSGPVEVGIGSEVVPWDLGSTNNIKPLFGVTVKNNWNAGGMIKKINNIIFKVPDSMSIDQSSCSIPVTPTSEQGESGFKNYKIVPRSPLEEIDDFITIGCLMNVDQGSLDPLPVTTRFLKIHVDYDYELAVTENVDVISLEESGVGSSGSSGSSGSAGSAGSGSSGSGSAGTQISCDGVQGPLSKDDPNSCFQNGKNVDKSVCCTCPGNWPTWRNLHCAEVTTSSNNNVCCELKSGSNYEYKIFSSEQDCQQNLDLFGGSYGSAIVIDDEMCETTKVCCQYRIPGEVTQEWTSTNQECLGINDPSIQNPHPVSAKECLS